MVNKFLCFCPSCGADLRNGSIHEDDYEMFGVDSICHGCGSESHFSRTIGIYDTEKDMTVAYRCPDCQYEEPRVITI